MTSDHKFCDREGNLTLMDEEKGLFRYPATLHSIRNAKGELTITTDRVIFLGEAQTDLISDRMSQTFLEKEVFGRVKGWTGRHIRFALSKHQLANFIRSDTVTSNESPLLTLLVFDTTRKSMKVIKIEMDFEMDDNAITEACGFLESLFDPPISIDFS